MVVGRLRGVLSLASAALAFGLATDAWAISLKVAPVRVVMTNGATSTMVELTNQGNDPLRVQATPYDWAQDGAGEDKLTPSTELLVFPSMIVLKPGETRRVRVGTQGGYGAGEKSFRILFAELPSNMSSAQGQQELLRVVANTSIPVFVRPATSKGIPKVEGVVVGKDRVKFAIRNTGNAHAMIEKVRVEALDGTGKVQSTDEHAGWYVLPNMQRPFEFAFGSKLHCKGAAALRVTSLSRDSGNDTFTVEKPTCAAP